jgi:hypothetical protein
MKIVIDYESSWRNSFLDGNNNEELPKKGRNFIASMTNLKKEDNFKVREVSIDTVMGLLNRLIGDQRKLYQARNDGEYFFSNIEEKIRFKDKAEYSNELIYIRNMKGSTDQNSFTGMIQSNDLMFSSDYSSEFWGVLFLEFEDLLQFFFDVNFQIAIENSYDPLSVMARLEFLDKEKVVENEGAVMDAMSVIVKNLPDEKYPNNDQYLNNKGLIKPVMYYCAALYIQLERLSEKIDMTSAKTKTGGISGISKRGFTKKDFMNRFTTGNKKTIWGNPFIKKEKIKGKGEVTSMLKKARGILEINIDIDRDKGREIEKMIENAGVSSFYLGKKGLAYVSSIRV